jgi:hypothetical protein
VSYTDAEVEPLARQLVAALPGLDLRLARVWIKSESGVGNNPLGVTHTVNGKTTLMTYPTKEAGITAAATLVKTSRNYAGIRASLNGGNVRQQALAIIASPWNARGSPYYTSVFGAAGLLGGGPSYSNPGSGGAEKPIGAWYTNGVPAVSFPAGYILKSTDPQAIVDKLDAAGWFKDQSGGVGGSAAKLVLRGQLESWVGKPWNDATIKAISGNLGANAGEATAGTSGITNPLGNPVDTAVSIATYGAALVVVVLGVFLYSRGSRQEVPVA